MYSEQTSLFAINNNQCLSKGVNRYLILFSTPVARIAIYPIQVQIKY